MFTHPPVGSATTALHLLNRFFNFIICYLSILLFSVPSAINAQIHEKPSVTPEASIKEVIVEISAKRLGVTAVIENKKIIGIITDGDLRRMLSNNDTFEGLTARDIMSASPKTIDNDAMAVTAKRILEENGISQLLATDQNTYSGVVHIHDLIKEGII